MRRRGGRGALGPAGVLALAALALLAFLVPLSGCKTLRHRRDQRPAYRTVSPAVAYSIILDSPDVIILDLRRPDEFQGVTGHLRGARNFPLQRLPYRLIELANDRDETLLVYCREDPACGKDGMAVLVASGFEDAILIEGGIDRWIRDGFKTVLSLEGATPESERRPR